MFLLWVEIGRSDIVFYVTNCEDWPIVPTMRMVPYWYEGVRAVCGDMDDVIIGGNNRR